MTLKPIPSELGYLPSYLPWIFSTPGGELLALLERKITAKGVGYKNVLFNSTNYLYAQGKIPILMVAHCDTVHEPRSPSGGAFLLVHDPENCILWSPQGLGADDRAGVLGILETLHRGMCPHLLFTLGEERGGTGVRTFCREQRGLVDTLPTQVRYCLEIDRAGIDHGVLYTCDGKNPVWEKYVAAQGFPKEVGSYSDVSTIMTETGLCGVNLAAGYDRQHSKEECLYYWHLDQTLQRVWKMLASPPAKPFLFEKPAPIVIYGGGYYPLGGARGGWNKGKKWRFNNELQKMDWMEDEGDSQDEEKSALPLRGYEAAQTRIPLIQKGHTQNWRICDLCHAKLLALKERVNGLCARCASERDIVLEEYSINWRTKIVEEALRGGENPTAPSKTP